MDRRERQTFRTCAGCNAKRGKFEMIRFVSSESGELVVDLLHRMEGRGAYLCPSPECFANVSKKKKNPFSWRLKKGVRPNTVEELKKIVANALDQLKGRNIPARVMELIKRSCALIEER